jgi:hypothetical protein
LIIILAQTNHSLLLRLFFGILGRHSSGSQRSGDNTVVVEVADAAAVAALMGG